MTSTSPQALAPNRVGLVGLLVVILSYLVPVGAFVVTLIRGAGHDSSAQTQGDSWDVIDGLFWAALSLVPAGTVALAGLIIAAIGAARKGRSKVAGIVGIVLSIMPILVALIALVIALTSNNGPQGVPING